MEKIQQTTLLMEHIKKSHMQDVFSFDVSTIAELFSFQPQEFLIEVGHNSDYLYFLTKRKKKCPDYPDIDKMNYLILKSLSNL